MFYRRVSMEDLAKDAANRGITHDTSLGATTVAVPPLGFGATFLDRWPIREEPLGASWREAEYRTYSPWVFTFMHATVHSSAGIVCLGDVVVEETLAHTDPDQHGYTLREGGIWIEPGPVATLRGTAISALAGSADSYYHGLLDGLARLSVVPATLLAGADSLLTSSRFGALEGLQEGLCRRWGLADVTVAERTGLRVERLVLGNPNHATCNYHPCVPAWFDTAGVAEAPGSPRAFYIDRRGSQARRLVNEAALVASLDAIGIPAIALEHLGAEAQTALFRNAELIVAPHGSGLANLVFARPGCRVIELQMDAYCHWGFRRLAALRGLRYDCVVGRAIGPLADASGPIHSASWQVSVPHVVAAVRSVLPGP